MFGSDGLKSIMLSTNQFLSKAFSDFQKGPLDSDGGSSCTVRLEFWLGWELLFCVYEGLSWQSSFLKELNLRVG
jgi:hypothetical protein